MKGNYTTISAHVSWPVRQALEEQQKAANVRSLSAYLGAILTEVAEVGHEKAKAQIAAEIEREAETAPRATPATAAA